MLKKLPALFFLLVCLPPPLFAQQSSVTVEGLQMPAWIERQGKRMPLSTDSTINSGDKLYTGKRARLLLRLQEGSLIKLGENAQLDMNKLEPPAQDDGLFSGFVNVLKGAFRFTTTALGANRKRNIDVRIGTITAGIRGTDIWGSSTSDKDLVCLIEGKIKVESGNDSFDMSDPLSFYIKPRNAPADPVAPVDPEKLTQWAQETELHSGAGVIKTGGGYALNLMSVTEQTLAESRIQRIHNAGYAASIYPVSIDGKQWYRIRIPGLVSLDDARGLNQQIAEDLNIHDGWISAI